MPVPVSAEKLAVSPEPPSRPPGPIALEVRNVTVSYGGPPVVEDVALAVAEGEIRGLIGPNGAGKTTLVNVISGLVKAKSGTIEIAGRDVTRLTFARRSRRGLSRTFQLPQASSLMTLEEQIVLQLPGFVWCGPGLRRNEHAARLREVLEHLGLTELRRRPVHSLALGQYRLFELARALAARPRVLLADEIASGMDSEAAAVLADALRWLASSGVAVLLIEHNIPFVRSVADRLTVLNLGRVIAEGDVADVLSSPLVQEAYLGRSEA